MEEERENMQKFRLGYFEMKELKTLRRLAKNYIRFRERDMQGFTFAFSHDPLKNLFKLIEAIPFIYYCSMRLDKKREEEQGNPYIIEKLESILNYLISFWTEVDEVIQEYNLSSLSFDREDYMRKSSEIINIRRLNVMKILTFLETLRPLNIKPLSKSVAGVSGEEFEDIIEEEGESEDI